ncbi:MAG: 30S ribosome-binding factor RbfA [Vampirovibrionales bacterium]
MPSSHRGGVSRVDKVRKALLKALGEVLRYDLSDPALEHQVISVTDIDLSPDMRHVKAYVSILAEEGEKVKLMTLLLELVPKIRFHLGQRVKLRFVPELSLELDESLERGTRVYHLIEQLSQGLIE